MKENNQGEGNYDYDCRKHDCTHCEIMKQKPKPQIYYPEPEQKEFSFKNVIIIPSRHWAHWSGSEMKLIRDNQSLPVNKICDLFPRRSKMSVMTRISRMRRDGLIGKSACHG